MNLVLTALKVVRLFTLINNKMKAVFKIITRIIEYHLLLAIMTANSDRLINLRLCMMYGWQGLELQSRGFHFRETFDHRLSQGDKSFCRLTFLSTKIFTDEVSADKVLSNFKATFRVVAELWIWGTINSFFRKTS